MQLHTTYPSHAAALMTCKHLHVQHVWSYPLVDMYCTMENSTLTNIFMPLNIIGISRLIEREIFRSWIANLVFKAHSNAEGSYTEVSFPLSGLHVLHSFVCVTVKVKI